MLSILETSDRHNSRRSSSFFRQRQIVTGFFENRKQPLRIRPHYLPGNLATSMYDYVGKPSFLLRDLISAPFLLLTSRLFAWHHQRRLRDHADATKRPVLTYPSRLLGRCWPIISIPWFPRAPQAAETGQIGKDLGSLAQRVRACTLPAVVLIILTNALLASIPAGPIFARICTLWVSRFNDSGHQVHASSDRQHGC